MRGEREEQGEKEAKEVSKNGVEESKSNTVRDGNDDEFPGVSTARGEQPMRTVTIEEDEETDESLENLINSVQGGDAAKGELGQTTGAGAPERRPKEEEEEEERDEEE